MLHPLERVPTNGYRPTPQIYEGYDPPESFYTRLERLERLHLVSRRGDTWRKTRLGSVICRREEI